VRWRLWLVLVIALGVGAAIAAPALTQGAKPRPNLVVAATPEPPDFEFAGNRFRLAFTVANEARGRAGASRAVAFLSPNAARGADDVRLGTGARVPALRGGRQATRRMTARIPASLAPGVYFLIVCADVGNRVRETRNADNCSVSGQRVGINAVGSPPVPGTTGPPGPQGEQGPPGDVGPAGEDVLRRLPPTTIAPASGETEERDVITVGPLIIRVRCINDDGTDPPDRAQIEATTTSGAFATRFSGESPAGTAVLLVSASRTGIETNPDMARVLITLENGEEYVFAGMAGVEVFGDGTPGDDGDDPCLFAGALMESLS
jgi:hypothetical protein